MCFYSARVFRIFLAMTCLVAALIFGSHWFHFLVAPVLPLIFPGFFIFGEEWEPRLGVWGALVVGWVISIPGTYILAWLLGTFILAPRHSPSGSHENT
jgi:hypothetical protein